MVLKELVIYALKLKNNNNNKLNMGFYLITYGQSLWIKVAFESIDLKCLDSKSKIFKFSGLDAFYRW